MQSGITTYVLCSILLISMNSVTLVATAEEVFSQKCMACHQTAEAVRNTQARIINALTPGHVRKHHFTLTDTEKELLIHYLGVVTKS